MFQWGRMYDHLNDHEDQEEEEEEGEEDLDDGGMMGNSYIDNGDDDDDVMVTGVVSKQEPQAGSVRSFLGKLQKRKRGMGGRGDTPSVRLPGGVTLTWNGGAKKAKLMDNDQDEVGQTTAGSVEIFPLPMPTFAKPHKVKQMERYELIC